MLHSLRHPQEADHDAAFLLTTLGRLWLAGVEVDWPALHGGKVRRLVLPTYPFERRRCWIEPQVSRDQGAALERRAAAADWFYMPSWQRAPVPAPPENAADPGRWLVFAGSRALGGIAAARLAEGGRRVAVVSAGDAFAERGGGYWTIRPTVADDYPRLLEALAAQDALPDRVLHLWSLDADGDPRDRGFYSLVFLVQALAGRGLTDPLALAVATTGAWEVVGGEALEPERTTVLGACRVIPQEYPHLSCRAVDLPPAAADAEEAWLAGELLAELAGRGGEPVVAYRGRYRWAQHFVPLPASRRGDGLRPRDGGVYLITGGLGRVGLVLAETLARGAREVKLVLTRRRELEAGEIRGLRELEALGAEVLPRAVDATDREAMAGLLAEIRERFGALHGVIHAAALTGAGALVPVGTAEREACEAQFRPKMVGAQVLAELLDGAELDYCLLISSLSTVLGGLGFAAYSAANHFLDAFAQAQSRGSRFPWLSVGWEAWRFDAVDAAPATALGAAVRGLALRPDEGRAAMEHLLALEPLPQVLISTVDLAARAAHWAEAAQAAREKIETKGELPADSGPAAERRDLQVAYVAPRDGVERQLVGVWSRLLGIAAIGIHDNFFELGGHSVLATQVVARLRRELRREVPLATFFAHPTIAGLAAELAADTTAVPGEVELSIPRRPRPDEVNEFPLSFAQQRFWFLDQLEPGNPAYHVPFVFRLGGGLRVGVLGRAFDALVRRHETLRTTFPDAGGEPVQAVGPPRRQALPVIDLGALAEPSQEREMRRLATARVRAPFALAREPQLRTTLIRLDTTDHVLVLSMHHIASDFWSMGVLTQELTRCYDAFSRGEEANLPELAVQYADYAVWQREWFAGGVLEEQLAYWRQTLEGAPAALDLPADHPRPRRPSYRNAARTMRLPAAETGALRELGQHHQATLFMVLIAAFSAFLHRLSGQRDVLLGTPAANRTRTELEGLIGLFVNTLVLRVDLAGDPGFLELIERVRRTVLGAQAHQDLPFEQLVDELQPERHLARAPLFQVLFVLQTAPVEAVRMPELSFRPVGTEAQASQFDLSFNIVEQADGLRAAVQYDSDLFDPTTIRRLLGQFRQLLAEIATAADRRLSLLPILRPAQRHQLLVEWNDPRPRAVSDDPRQRSLHALFERWVERTPGAPAVSFEGEGLSYRELNARANQLAHRLCELGVGPEVVVGICLERGVAMVVAILAILKTGGAYLPLDPAHPPQRRRFMADDAGIGILITAGGLWDAGEGQESLIVLDADRERRQLAERSAAGPRSDEAMSAASPAYVIYTSGSTGRVKGTVITHDNVIRLFEATAPWFDFGPGDVWTLFHSYAFDFSVWEIWGALLYGGRLVLVPDEVRRSPRDFYELLVREGVTILNQTPAAFRSLVEAEEEIAAAGRRPELALREVIFGGEAVDLVSLGPWFRRHGERRPRLVNMYGITETTVHVTYRRLGEGDLRRPGSSPIGVAIPDLPVVLVDAGLRPVSIGVAGEIVVAGAGLARCYLGRPALTAERFVPNPFSRQPGDRLYRSGDLARHLPDGGLEYLGRIDHQVKIRGFRIELGEVEAVLAEHSGVRQVVAVLRGEPRDQRLVGYVVPAGEAPVAGELDAFLRRRLPDYMVPQAFVLLESLPLTPNGKVDRRALPAPSPERPELEEAFVAPRNPIEEQLAAIWCQVLGLDRVGVHDNFFQVGGHSLLATQVASRVRHELGVELPLALVFESPTIAGLAETYWQQQIDRDGDELAALLDELGELSDEEAEMLAADGES